MCSVSAFCRWCSCRYGRLSSLLAGNRAPNRTEDHYLRPNPFMAHLSTGQIPAANVQLLKDGRLAPAGGLDLNGVSVGVSNADCRGPNMAEVFPAGEQRANEKRFMYMHAHSAF